MSKTLREVLLTNRFKKCNVKIHSIDGSSFWYCGIGDSEISFPLIEKENISTRKTSRAVLERLKYRLENLDKIYEKEANKRIRKGLVKNVEVYLQMVEKRKEIEREELPKRIEDIRYDIHHDLLDRPVVEIFEGISPDEAPCYIIYVKGNEKGFYWTVEEHARKHKKI